MMNLQGRLIRNLWSSSSNCGFQGCFQQLPSLDSPDPRNLWSLIPFPGPSELSLQLWISGRHPSLESPDPRNLWDLIPFFRAFGTHPPTFHFRDASEP